MKKFIFVVMAAFVVRAYAFGAHAIVDGCAWYYDIKDNGDAEITYCWEPKLDEDGLYSGDLVVPAFVDGRKVSSIGYRAFIQCRNLTSIIIPEGVTEIGVGAFEFCSSLKSISLPCTVESIGGWAFLGCDSLECIELPDSVVELGSSAFEGCRALECISIPQGISSINDSTFEYCHALQFINISSNVLSVSSRAFANCGAICNFVVDDANPNYRAINGSLCSKDGKELIAGVASSSIPNGVEVLGDYAYSGRTSTCDVLIPNSVTTIGDWVFSGCSSLTSVTIPDSVTKIGEDAFSQCSSLTSVTIPDSVTTIGASAFRSCSSLVSVTIPDSVTAIGSYAFYGCNSFTSVTIPNSVTEIEYGAFYDCSSLASVTIPDGVTSIGEVAFCGCSSLTSIMIPASVTTIGDYAFGGCTALERVVIPNSRINIHAEAFRGCSGIKFIEVPGLYKVSALFPDAYQTINEAVIHDGVQSIIDSEFYGCSSLIKIDIPKSVTSIGSDAFAKCNSLTSLCIPETIKYIGERAFAYCNSVRTVKIYCQLDRFPFSTFTGCERIINVELGTGGVSTALPIIISSSGWSNINETYMGLNVHRSNNIPIYSPATIEMFIPAGCKQFSFYRKVTNASSDMLRLYIDNVLKYSLSGTKAWGMTGVTILDDNRHHIAKFVYERNVYQSSGYGWIAIDTSPNPTTLKELFPNAYDKITEVSILEGVKNVGVGLFCGCSSLSLVTIPIGVESIGQSAFDGCLSLRKLLIPESVSIIGDGAFYGCESLKEVSLPVVNRTMESLFPSSYDRIENVSLSENQDIIVDNMFAGCKALKSVAISQRTCRIGSRAFNQCSSLESFDIPKAVEVIGDDSFVGCSSLERVYLYREVNVENTGLVNSQIRQVQDVEVVIDGIDKTMIYNGSVQKFGMCISSDVREFPCDKVLCKKSLYTDDADVGIYKLIVSTNDFTVGDYDTKQFPTVEIMVNKPVYNTEITPRELRISSKNASKIYDGMLLTASYSISGDGFVDGECEVVAVNSQTSVGSCKNAITLNWTEGASASNYDITIEEGELTVLPRSVSVTSGIASKVYDGIPLTASYSIGGDGFVDGECDVSASSRTTAGSSKNEVTLNWAEGASADNYDISIQEGELTVLPRNVSIISGSGSKVYDGTPLMASYSVGGDGFVDGECALAATSSQTSVGLCKNEVTLNWEEGASADNYDISIQEGELTVLPRSVSITSGSASKVYDGTPLTASYSIGGGGFVDGECDVSVSSRTAAGSSKNEVTLSWAEGASADNYAITIKEGTLTITPAKVPRIATTAFSTTYSYDGEEHTINVAGVESITLIDPPRFSYALSAEGPWQEEAPTFKDAGRYSVWYKISADNYEDYIQEACVTILPRKMVIASGDAEKFYDGVPLTCCTAEVTVGGLVDGDAFTVNFTGAQLDEGESQNTFDIVWDGSAKESNYEVRKDYGTLKVTRLFGDVGDESIAYTYPYSYKKMIEVTFREGVEMITHGQFSGCDSLRIVKLPDSLRVIDCYALDDLPNIEWQVVDGYKMMDGWIFGYTEDAAEELSCVDEIRGVASGALEGCTALRRFVCSDASKLKSVSNAGFKYCTKLEKMVLPEGLKNIGDDAFLGCTKLSDVIVPGTVDTVGVRAFRQCTNLMHAQIAHGVKSILKEAFYGDWRISEVDLPSTVTNIEGNVFGGDSSIIRAGMRGDVCKVSEVFSNYAHIREFTVKEGDGEIVDGLFMGCAELNSVHFMGNCPQLANDGKNLYAKAGTAGQEMPPDEAHSSVWTNAIELVTYVVEGSTGWDGIPNSEALPQSWPLEGGYRHSIAFWDVPTYLCQFDANGGTLGVQDTYQYSEKKIALPPEPVQSGYTFDGWWTQPIGGLRVTENTTFIEGVYTYLWAHWVKGHWVFLDPNGGECVNEFVTYVDQSVYGVLPTPVKSGYSFGGWLYNGYVIEPETTINEKADHTLIAQWTANKYKVQYHPNGGVGELVDEDWVYGETKTLKRNAFTRAGFDFVGWAMSATATKAQYKDEEPLTSLTAKADEVVVLYAVWEKSASIDPTNVTFTNAGDADWQRLAQLVIKTEGTHSVATPVVWQSGKIGDNQSSILKTKVSGKGNLEFWWRVSCESFRTQKLDHLAFMVDGVEVKWINGEKDWAYSEHEILTSGEHEIAWTYNKDDEESDGEDCGAVCAVVWTPRLTELADYLNADELTFSTSGAAEWFGTTEVSHDGAGAAQSGKIGDNQESRLETTVNGEGMISFWWKVNCEAYRTYKLDHIAFFIDGVEQKWINGNKDWMRESFEVKGSGVHTLAWVYAKDEEGTDGEDCAWVDDVVWAPAPKPSRPIEIEGASSETQAAFEAWVQKYGVTNPSAANVNAFVLGLAPEATEEEIQEAVEEELKEIDFAALAQGDITAAVEAIQAKYPNAAVELDPVNDLETSAHLYKLVIKLK